MFYSLIASIFTYLLEARSFVDDLILTALLKNPLRHAFQVC